MRRPRAGASRRRSTTQHLYAVWPTVQGPQGPPQTLLGALQGEGVLVLEVRKDVPQQGAAEATHAVAQKQGGVLRRVWGGVPGREVADEPPAQSQQRFRSAVSLQGVREDFWIQELATDTYPDSYRYATVGKVVSLVTIRINGYVCSN